MWANVVLVVFWLIAFVYACWYAWTSDVREERAERRRLIREINRHIDNEESGNNE